MKYDIFNKNLMKMYTMLMLKGICNDSKLKKKKNHTHTKPQNRVTLFKKANEDHRPEARRT